jgi:hypothetical protein
VTGQAQQQTAHDVPDRATTRFVPRKMRGEGNQNLHGRRAEADQKRNREKRAGLAVTATTQRWKMETAAFVTTSLRFSSRSPRCSARSARKPAARSKDWRQSRHSGMQRGRSGPAWVCLRLDYAPRRGFRCHDSLCESECAQAPPTTSLRWQRGQHLAGRSGVDHRIDD